MEETEVDFSLRPWTAELGATAVASWQASGLSQRGWCQRHGVKSYQLSYWHVKLRDRLGESPAVDDAGGVGAFLRVLPGQSAAPAVEVHCAAGARIQVRSGFDAPLLRSVVEALQ